MDCKASVLRAMLLAGGSAIVYTLFAGSAFAQSQPTPAQTATPDQASVVDEVIVTAQRRSQRLQDVPIAISALGSEELSSRGISDATDLRGVVPGLSVSHTAGVNASNLISIRGVAGLPQPIGTGLATAVYLDGVYLSRPEAAFFGLDDIERIEVLRGPQGTLYGRNATAGAVNIITRTPGDSLLGGLDLSTGNYSAFAARGSISGPLSDTFAAGLSGSYRQRDGFIRNTVTGNELGAVEDHTIRGVLRYHSSDGRLDARLSADDSRSSGQDVFKNLYAFPGAAFVGPGNPDEVSLDAASENLIAKSVDSRGAALVVTYKVSDAIELTSITSARDLKADTVLDVDGSAFAFRVSAIHNTSKTFNQEVRGNFTSDRFRLTLGANYYHEEASIDYGSVAPTPTIALGAPFDSTELTAFAVFGQAEFDITDRLTLVGGLRYNNEDRDFTIDYSGAPVPGLKSSGNVSDEVWLPSVGLNFDLAPDILLYAKYGEGYQAPGFNGFPGATAPFNTFGAEQLKAYEAGFKSQFLARRLTLNAAAFYYEYSDLQVRGTPGPGLTDIRNAANATLKGVEASLSLRVNRFLSLGAQLTYLDTGYDDFCEVINGGAPRGGDPLCDATHADRSGNALSQAPEWSGGVNAQLNVPFETFTLKGTASYSKETNSFYTPTNEDLLSTGGWERIDARLGAEFNNGLELYVYGKNLTDDRYQGYALRAAANIADVTFNEPRTYGIGLAYHF